jgi:autotransporter-associated beta strand protein
MAMTDVTWNTSGDGHYNTASNWSGGSLPGPTDTGFFGRSADTSISLDSSTTVGEWFFVPGASQYSFTIVAATVVFSGGGIIVDGGSVNINNQQTLVFFNNSTAGKASITNNVTTLFNDVSTAGSAIIINKEFIGFSSSSSAENAVITNNGTTAFFDLSTADSATIHTTNGGQTLFENNSNGGNAQLITDPGGKVDFSFGAGPANNHQLTVGSIAGGGTYDLGADQVTVGLNGLSTIVSGPIDDGGSGSGSGASLVKVGHGALKLSHAGNTYSSGTTLKAGTLDLAAFGAAGPGAITFAGAATLKIEKGALSGHVFGNLIDFFGKHDVIDLTGLAFHAGATATYHAASHHLAVHSGSVTDTLTLLSPLHTHFEAISDGHGGTDLLLHA